MWRYNAYQRAQEAVDQSAYVMAEGAARMARRGLWSQLSPFCAGGFEAHGASGSSENLPSLDF